MNPGLQLSSIRVAYGLSANWVLRDLNFGAIRGERVGVVGYNGSGKSTLAHALIGVIPFITPGRVAGSACLGDREIFSLNLGDRLELIGYSVQDVESQILFGDVATAVGLRDTDSDHSLVRGAIDAMRVAHLLSRRPDQLSGGEAQRVALVVALRRGPGVAIFDEASSALDPRGRLDFESLLTLLSDGNRVVILLGQRPEILTPYCSRLTALVDGQLRPLPVEQSEDTVFETNALTFWTSVPFRPLPGARTPPEIRLSGVTFGYKGLSAFRFGPIDLLLEGGETVAVLGPNGSGKTTLLMLLAGVRRPNHGMLFLDRAAYRSAAAGAWPSTVSIVTQSPLDQIIGATVSEEIEKSSLSGTVGTLFDQAFPYLGLERDPLELSYGQQRMLTLLSAFLGTHPVLLIDEPEQGLDTPSLAFVKAWMRLNKERRSRTVIFSTHDLDLAAELADRCILFNDGQFVGESSTRDRVRLERWYFQGTSE